MDLTENHPSRTSAVRRWPLLLIAAPAAVAIWSGWVGLGELCGFGIVHPLPGIAGGFRLNTAITLPVGVEVYGAYALGVWLGAVGAPRAARAFARRSAIGSLLLGMTGQVAYHLLAAAHRTRAPWEVTVLVSCVPVVVLGLAAALAHLQTAAGYVPEPEPQPVPGPPADSPEPPAADAELDRLIEWLTSGSNAVPDVPGHLREAEREFAAEVTRGELPSIRVLRSRLRVGQDRATEVQAYLRTLTRTPSLNGQARDAS